MGLIQTLIDEILPFPSPIRQLDLLPNNRVQYVVSLPYALLNLIFQTIDCVIVPILFFYLLKAYHLGFFRLVILGLLGFSLVFSWMQVLRFFIAPYDKYCSFLDRLLGETAIGYCIAALFGLKISYSN